MLIFKSISNDELIRDNVQVLLPGTVLLVIGTLLNFFCLPGGGIYLKHASYFTLPNDNTFAILNFNYVLWQRSKIFSYK